jgi:polyhydroxyalkanoate synthesis regulator phasin
MNNIISQILHFLRLFTTPLSFGDNWEDQKEPDFRKINLNNPKEKEYCDNMVRDYIMRSLNQMGAEGVFRLIQENELYYEGFTTPIAAGVSSDYLGEFVRAHSKQGPIDTTAFRVQVDEKTGNLYANNNKIKKVVDNMVGDYTMAKKETTVKQDGRPKNDGIARAVKVGIANQEREKQIWAQVRIPCIEGMMKCALKWSNWTFNPDTNNGSGDIEIKTYDARDVLVDPFSKEKYFMDARYIIRRERMPLKEAQEYFAQFTKQPIVADNDYYSWEPSIKEIRQQTGIERFVTVYKGEFKRLYTDKIPVKEVYKNENVGPIGEEKIRVEKVQFFDFLYTRQTGVVKISPNKYINPRLTKQFQFKTIPYYNQQSAVRQFPLSEVEKLKPLQDMANILDSVVLNNARTRDKFRMAIDKAMFDNYGPLWMDFIKNGGYLPIDLSSGGSLDAKSVKEMFANVELPPVTAELIAYIETNAQAFRDQSIAHEALEGNYPESGNISGVAISKLQAANKRSISYKDINIEWAVTQENILLYRMMAEEFSNEDWIEIEQVKKGEPGYVPINAGMSFADYEAYLAEEYPGMEIEQAVALFQKDNDVQYQWTERDPNTGGYRPMEDIKQQKSWVYINHLTDPESNRPYDMQIKVVLDFEAAKDEILELIQTAEERKMGAIANKTYLQKMYPDSWEDKYNDWLEENQAMQLGTQIQKLPEQAQQLVQQVVQQASQPQAKAG